MADDTYLNTLDRMEPDIAAVDLTAAAASMAISFKRLADAAEALLPVAMRLGHALDELGLACPEIVSPLEPDEP